MKPFALVTAALAVLASLPAAGAQAGLLPPMNLDAHHDAQNHTLTLTWDPPLDAGPDTTYNVYQDDTLLTNVATLAYTDENFVTNLTQAIVFRVHAVQLGQESAAAHHIFLFNGILETCHVLVVGPTPAPPFIAQIDWTCIWSIVHSIP